MSTPIPIDFNLDLQLSPQTSAAAPCDCVTSGNEKLFKDILADENLLNKVMEKLKELLPEEVYAQFEEMVESGNGLPLAAILSLELPLFTLDLNKLQENIKLDTSQITAFVDSVKKVSDNLPQQNGNSADKALDNLGRTISEVLSQISTKGEGLGKQIQELVTSAKADFAALESGSKLTMPTISGADLSVTQSTAQGTAISGLAQPTNIQTNNLFATPPPITTAMGGESWGQAVGDRIMWMVGKGVQAASIRINPPHLGPIQIQMSVQNEQASVQMVVQHGAVKEALDAAMPRLREMLNESNLQLVNVDVSHRDSPENSSQTAMFGQDQREQMEQFLQDQELLTEADENTPRYYLSTALIDDYA
jgi:flagellar hook-length control protein FliK